MGVTAAILGAAAIGGATSLYASNQASKAQSSAARSAAQLQQQGYDRQEALQEPFRQAGLTAQNRMMTLLGMGDDLAAPDFGKYARDFGESDFKTDPGYGFRLSEGMKALERSAAARGGLLSGATMKGAIRFGQDSASGEYLNAFNRYQTNRSNQLNPLQSLFGAGQSSTNLLSNAAGQTGQGMASAAMAGGQARASGYTSMASNLNNSLSTGANLYMQRPVYNAMAGYYERGNQPPGNQPPGNQTSGN